MSDEEELKMRIFVNSDANMSRGKYAAAAVHAALLATGAHPNTPVIVLGGSRAEIEKLRTVVRDAGRTEVDPGTVTAGTDWAVEDAAKGFDASECWSSSSPGVPRPVNPYRPGTEAETGDKG